MKKEGIAIICVALVLIGLGIWCFIPPPIVSAGTAGVIIGVIALVVGIKFLK